MLSSHNSFYHPDRDGMLALRSYWKSLPSVLICTSYHGFGELFLIMPSFLCLKHNSLLYLEELAFRVFLDQIVATATRRIFNINNDRAVDVPFGVRFTCETECPDVLP